MQRKIMIQPGFVNTNIGYHFLEITQSLDQARAFAYIPEGILTPET